MKRFLFLLIFSAFGLTAANAPGVKNGTDGLAKNSESSADINKLIWNLLIKEHKKKGGKNPLLNYDDEADRYYEENKTDAGVCIFDSGADEAYCHAFKCYPLADGSVKVYEYVANLLGYNASGEDEIPTSFHFYCFRYKDGKLTRLKNDPDIEKPLGNVRVYKSSPVKFTDDNGLEIEDEEFRWDGEKFIKKK